MPTALHLFVTMLAHLHSSVNFCVYMICNRNFRSAIWRLLTCRSQDKLSSSVCDSKTGANKVSKSTTSTNTNSAYVTASSKALTPTVSSEAE
ncbi:hypothetical protein ElyMa_000575900 [Elysia marginata]|uniref:G-protein coupled receptors family 1 profile domain-containing protein n=1 Tax=Elysia marginata TaxID=1093978 RepID=A0AAV4G499_9GAST|nr:hypothetical protein ElyMa_000575900 [Elysia marginata]